MGGFHDILSKVISSIRIFVDHEIWSMRRLGDYDVRRNSAENVPELILVVVFFIIITSNLKAL